MPQMSPYNWLFLNLLFSMTFMMFIIMLNFFPLKLKMSLNSKNKYVYMIKW